MDSGCGGSIEISSHYRSFKVLVIAIKFSKSQHRHIETM